MHRMNSINSQDQLDHDIFLSYNWSHKPYVRRLYEELRNHLNLKIWIDDNELGHTSLTAQLAKGISKSRILLYY